MSDHLILPTMSTWPSSLGELDDPPDQLWARGDLAVLGDGGLAVIGTRCPDEDIIRLVEAIARDLAGQDHLLISGASPGVDTAVHRGAMDAGGPNVAVVPGGLDRPHEPGQDALVESIARSPRGLVLTESPLGTLPDADRRLARDRLQAALAAKIIVMQTEIDGGAMHTVEVALRLGRVIAVLDPGLPRREGAGWSGSAELLTREGVARVGIEEVSAWASAL